MLKLQTRWGTAAVLVLMSGCGSDDDVESTTEPLRPAATQCVTSDDCLYGYCSTEDGRCRGPSCPPGTSSCPAVCYGTCVAAAPPQ